MTKPIKASEHGLEPHYKVRVVIDGALLHLASRDEPHEDHDPYDGGAAFWAADWIADPRYGDTIGFINWSQVAAITWRWSE